MSTPARATILAVDDEPSVLWALTRFLREAGYDVIEARDGSEALEHLQTASVDLVLSDRVMPGMPGLQLCQALRHTSTVPFIFLSTMASWEAIRMGFEAGGDDYLPKTSVREHGLARIATVLDWAKGHSHEKARRVLTVGQLRLDESRLQVRVGDRESRLCAVEYRLLRCLCAHPGEPSLRRDLAAMVCGAHLAAHGDALVDLLVERVRRKVERDPTLPACLLTAEQGYVLKAETSPSGSETTPDAA